MIKCKLGIHNYESFSFHYGQFGAEWTEEKCLTCRKVRIKFDGLNIDNNEGGKLF